MTAHPALSFALRFGLGLALAAIAYPLVHVHRLEWIAGWVQLTANAEYHFFRLFAEEVTLAGPLLSIDDFQSLIIMECTGVFEILVFTAAVCAAPASWRGKVAGVCLGIPLLLLLNLVRLAALIAIGRYLPAGFDFAHQYLWQGAWIFVACWVWVVWLSVVIEDVEVVPRPS